MTNEPPVTDAADYVSAFLSLPETLQGALLSVLFAARDLPTGQPDAATSFLAAASKLEQLEPEIQHFLKMCSGIFTSLYIARATGYGAEPGQ